MEGSKIEETSQPNIITRYGVGWLTILLSAVMILSAGLTIGFELAEAKLGEYVFKPATTSIIIIIALLALDPPKRQYKWLIVFGLGFSLIGDILLMLPSDLFLFGLVAFLIAHIFYSSAFSSVAGFYRSFRGALPFLAYGVVITVYLWSHFGDMLVPALIYMVIILLMGWQGLGQWQQTGERRALLAFIGALLFLVSDSLLAINRFANPIALSPLFVLGTYYPAQWFIAMSAGSEHL